MNVATARLSLLTHKDAPVPSRPALPVQLDAGAHDRRLSEPLSINDNMTRRDSGCKAENAPPRRIAFCIAGAARTFTAPIIQAGIRDNFFGPLAAWHGQANLSQSRFFVLVKTDDSTKLGMGAAFHASNDRFSQHHTDKTNLLRVLTTSWFTPMLAAAAVVEGSGAHEWLAPAENASDVLVYAVGNATMWQRFRATYCNESKATSEQPGCCQPDGPFRGNTSSANEARLIHQHMNLRWCYKAILHQEAKQGWTFELVAYTRPDVLWYAPVLPSCAVANRWPWQTHVLSCFYPGCDMTWVAPRQHATRIMDQVSLRRDCRSQHTKRHGKFGHMFARDQLTCCAAAEWLQWYTYLSPNANAADGIPVFQSNTMVPEKGAFGILRQVKGACQIALARRIGRDFLAHVNHMNGLSASVGFAIRRMFNETDRLGCHAATNESRTVHMATQMVASRAQTQQSHLVPNTPSTYSFAFRKPHRVEHAPEAAPPPSPRDEHAPEAALPPSKS